MVSFSILMCCELYSGHRWVLLSHIYHLYSVQAERRSHKIEDEMYELYAALVAVPASTGENFCYKSYHLVSHSTLPSSICVSTWLVVFWQGECGYVTLKESTQLISQGTTGLTTWQVMSSVKKHCVYLLKTSACILNHCRLLSALLSGRYRTNTSSIKSLDTISRLP